MDRDTDCETDHDINRDTDRVTDCDTDTLPHTRLLSRTVTDYSLCTWEANSVRHVSLVSRALKGCVILFEGLLKEFLSFFKACLRVSYPFLKGFLSFLNILF